MQKFLNEVFWGNSIQAYIVALGIFLIGLAILFIFRKIILSGLKKWAEKTETRLDDLLAKAIEKAVLPLLYIFLFYLAANTLKLSEEFLKWMNIILSVIVTFFAVKVIIAGLNHFLLSQIKKQEDSDRREKQLKGIRGFINLVIWLVALVFLLDNMGVEIAAVVAGLGIGGIAIALAAQTVLGDLFSYFVIFFDRPFEIGDFIIIDDKIGSVEFIGIKTTRIRALSGEQLVFSNTDLTNSRVHNFKKMERRRVLFRLGVVYQTSYDKLIKIQEIVKEIISRQENATFDRGHFATYGDFSLNFEFVYYLEGADYNMYMDTQQRINLEIFKKFEGEGIEFAYPTQTVFVNNQTGGII